MQLNFFRWMSLAFVGVVLAFCPSLALAQATACGPAVDCFGFDADPGGTRLCGTAGDDADLEGTALGERLCGLDGNDVLAGGEGADLLNGNQGADEVNGNQGDDVVRGGKGDDLVRGGQGDDEVHGDDGNDDLWGDLGDDRLFGGAGIDTYHFREGDGGDTVDDADSTIRVVFYDIAQNDALIFSPSLGGDCQANIFPASGGSISFPDHDCGAIDFFFAEEECVADFRTLCLQDGRFEVTVDFVDPAGQPGIGRLVYEVDSDDSGLFWFFDADNWEMLVKVIDGCGFNNHYWVFAAATTNVEFTLTVTDRTTGDRYMHFNPAGTLASPLGDIEALPTCP